MYVLFSLPLSLYFFISLLFLLTLEINCARCFVPFPPPLPSRLFTFAFPLRTKVKVNEGREERGVPLLSPLLVLFSSFFTSSPLLFPLLFSTFVSLSSISQSVIFSSFKCSIFHYSIMLIHVCCFLFIFFYLKKFTFFLMPCDDVRACSWTRCRTSCRC